MCDGGFTLFSRGSGPVSRGRNRHLGYLGPSGFRAEPRDPSGFKSGPLRLGLTAIAEPEPGMEKHFTREAEASA